MVRAGRRLANAGFNGSSMMRISRASPPTLRIRSESQDALAKSEESHRLLAEQRRNRYDPAHVASLGEPTYSASPASWFALGYRPEELAGRSVWDFIHAGDRNEPADCTASRARNAAHIITFRLRRRDGSFACTETAFQRAGTANGEYDTGHSHMPQCRRADARTSEELNCFKHVLDKTEDIIFEKYVRCANSAPHLQSTKAPPRR